MKDSPLESDLRSRFAAVHADARPVANPLITVADIGEEPLLELIHDNTLGVLAKEFIPRDDALEIASKLLVASTWSTYKSRGAEGIAINGDALFSCGGDRACDDYFKSAVRTRRAVREVLAPHTCPIDLIQAELDSAWKPGTRVLTLNGRKCHVGLQRCFREGGEALHHTDRARVDFDHPKTARMQFQLAANCYLSTAAGGELELWNLLPPDDLYDQARYEFGPTYAVRGNLLPPPDLVIRPEPGDFLMFNAAKVHRVRPVLGDGARVTVSLFAGFFSLNEPLEIFS